MKKVYYAGKINKNDWRHTLYENLRKVDVEDIKSYKKFLTISEIEYNGPYFISCDHGCFHGENSHGVGVGYEGDGACTELGLTKAKAMNNCLDEIKSSDIVFAYIESMDCYGTISEIGYAKALAKPIYIVVDDSKLSKSEIEDLWFILRMAKKVVKQSDIVLAHKDFVDWVVNSAYLHKEKSNLASDKQIDYIKGLAKRYDYKLITTTNMDSTEARLILRYMTGETTIIPACFYKYFVIKD